MGHPIPGSLLQLQIGGPISSLNIFSEEQGVQAMHSPCSNPAHTVYHAISFPHFAAVSKLCCVCKYQSVLLLIHEVILRLRVNPSNPRNMSISRCICPCRSFLQQECQKCKKESTGTDLCTSLFFLTDLWTLTFVCSSLTKGPIDF